MNLVFDFGAVLFKWQPAEILTTCFPEWTPSPEAAGQLAHSIFSHADWHSFDQGTLTMAQVVQRTASRLALPHDRLQDLVARIGDLLTPIEASVHVLARLAQRRRQQGSQSPDVRLYFLSNMPQCCARVLEGRHAFLKWFEGGIFSGDVHLIKPDPAIYALLEDRYQLDPTETLFIDDLNKNVDAARARGWRAIHFRSPGQMDSELVAAGF